MNCGRGVRAQAMEAMNEQLWEAAKGGNLEGVRQARGRGADLNSADEEGDTALHLACRKGHEEVMAFLIGEGAEVNPRNKHLFTPLMYAAIRGHARIVKLLLEAGADATLKSKFGRTARDWARENNHTAVIAELDAWEVRAEGGGVREGEGPHPFRDARAPPIARGGGSQLRSDGDESNGRCGPPARERPLEGGRVCNASRERSGRHQPRPPRCPPPLPAPRPASPAA